MNRRRAARARPWSRRPTSSIPAAAGAVHGCSLSHLVWAGDPKTSPAARHYCGTGVTTTRAWGTLRRHAAQPPRVTASDSVLTLDECIQPVDHASGPAPGCGLLACGRRAAAWLDARNRAILLRREAGRQPRTPRPSCRPPMHPLHRLALAAVAACGRRSSPRRPRSGWSMWRPKPASTSSTCRGRPRTSSWTPTGTAPGGSTTTTTATWTRSSSTDPPASGSPRVAIPWSRSTRTTAGAGFATSPRLPA
jgi:hypothetical protein